MKIAVVGLGYVGLPLAIEFGKIYETLGFDISKNKILNYKSKKDPNGEVKLKDFIKSIFLSFTDKPDKLSEADVIIVAVPTPVDINKKPDLTAVIESSKIVGQKMKRHSIVIFEPTVYPGVTEDICIPILEKFSKMQWKKDFNVGYSPERINPGDKDRYLTQIVKVVSADNEITLDKISALYSSIIKAGIFRASSIKVAEAAKVIENTQRDLNIALMNELAIIFNKADIDTSEVIEVASSKWNFMPFRPGLVGGHCIGVDPYYLTYKAETLGYTPQVILAGRQVNDNMALYIAEKTIENILKLGVKLENSKIIVLGVSFKENCSDLRNSKVIDLINILKMRGVSVYINDPVVDENISKVEYDIKLVPWGKLPLADAIIAAVSHQEYLKMGIKVILEKLKAKGTFVDVKSSYRKNDIVNLGFNLWRL
ncbi:nucleotide sugar dehydrogenase [Alphaproteobacteria bacterium]|nr:nucleotide sugar dehydrogenase [Alphaproteobacteria bacterium]